MTYGIMHELHSNGDSSSHRPQLPGPEAVIIDLTTIDSISASNNSAFPLSTAEGRLFNIQEPAITSYADLKLLVPAHRKPICPVVRLCNVVRIIDLGLTEDECLNPV